MKKAIIDIGTNSVKLTVGERSREQGIKILFDVNVITKLGEGMQESGTLSREAMTRTAQALSLIHISRQLSDPIPLQ